MSSYQSALHVQRLHTRYLISPQHPQPEGVRARLDQVMQTQVVPALQAAIQPVLASDEDGILLIRRVETRVMVQANESNESALGSAIGRSLATRITHLAQRPADPENVRYFPDWASYVAQYILDRLSGRADTAWYYRPFSGLRNLTLSQAIVEALLLRPETASSVLIHLAQRGELMRAIAALTENQAQRVVNLLRGRSTPSLFSNGTSLSPVFQAWVQSQIPGVEVGSARHLLAVWVVGLNQTHNTEATTLQTTLRQADESTSAGLHDHLLSICGDFFWLLPSFLALQPALWLDSAAPDPETAALWRYWLALKCLGSSRWEQARSDPGLLLALGLKQPPSEEAQQIAANDLRGGPGAALQKGLWKLLREQGRVLGSPLIVDQAALPSGTPIGILRDVRRDDWLCLVEDTDALTAAVLDLQNAFGSAQNLDDLIPFGGDLPLEPRLETFKQKARPVGVDLDYLHLPGLPLAANLILTSAARAVLRTFAGRLMGFAWSSLPYLHSNFLVGAAHIEYGRDRIQVSLPSPPLHTVLRMTGFRGEELSPAWLGGRIVQLRWAEES